MTRVLGSKVREVASDGIDSAGTGTTARPAYREVGLGQAGKQIMLRVRP